MIALIALKTQELMDIDKAIQYISTSILEDSSMDLFERNFRFALQPVDKRIGELKIQDVHWSIFWDGNKKIRKIELVQCSEFESDEKWANFLSDRLIKEQLAKGEKLLCPKMDSMLVEGQWGD